MRLCLKCRRELSESRFYTVYSKRNGKTYLRHTCMACYNAMSMDAHRRSPEKHRQSFQRWIAKKVQQDPTFNRKRRKLAVARRKFRELGL